MAFKIFTDSSSDLTPELREKYDISYFRFGISINDDLYHADIDWKEYSPEQLYEWVGNTKNRCKTSLLSFKEILEKAEPVLKAGYDILYIACTDALTGSRSFFEVSKQELLDKYPGRKMISINSCRAVMALGMMCIECAKLRDKGATLEECYEWVENNKQLYHQVGSLETLTYLKAAGRVSGAAAFFGNMINLKPIIMFDRAGHNYAFKKVKGRNLALKECFEYIKENIVPGVTDVIYVGQAMAKEQQAYFKKRIEEELNIPVVEFWIGPIVGISCGPGMYGVWFKGKEVTVLEEK